MKIKPISKFLKFFLSKDIVAITLCPFGIYTRTMKETTINHEKIHWKQQVEMLVIPFYLWYIIEYYIKTFTNSENAYRSISFEREAFANANNLEYLNSRKPYAWVKHICKKP